jgi:transaldolase
MKHNPLRTLNALGQSIWLDYIRRDLVTSGELTRLIEDDGLRGMTSNPAIFERAISNSADYDDEIRTLRAGGSDVWTIYDTLTRHDVQMAAGAFRSVYEQCAGRDGYVSLKSIRASRTMRRAQSRKAGVCGAPSTGRTS